MYFYGWAAYLALGGPGNICTPFVLTNVSALWQIWRLIVALVLLILSDDYARLSQQRLFFNVADHEMDVKFQKMSTAGFLLLCWQMLDSQFHPLDACFSSEAGIVSKQMLATV